MYRGPSAYPSPCNVMNKMAASRVGGLDGITNILDKFRLEGGIGEFPRHFHIVRTVFDVAWVPLEVTASRCIILWTNHSAAAEYLEVSIIMILWKSLFQKSIDNSVSLFKCMVLFKFIFYF